MKVVTAIDSFKGSMTSMEAGAAAAEGIRRVDANAEISIRPLADGGEGTVEAHVARDVQTDRQADTQTDRTLYK